MSARAFPSFWRPLPPAGKDERARAFSSPLLRAEHLRWDNRDFHSVCACQRIHHLEHGGVGGLRNCHLHAGGHAGRQEPDSHPPRHRGPR